MPPARFFDAAHRVEWRLGRLDPESVEDWMRRNDAPEVTTSPAEKRE